MKYKISSGSRYTESVSPTPKSRSNSGSIPESAPFLLLACIGLWLLFGGYEKVTGGVRVQVQPSTEYPANTI